MGFHFFQFLCMFFKSSKTKAWTFNLFSCLLVATFIRSAMLTWERTLASHCYDWLQAVWKKNCQMTLENNKETKQMPKPQILDGKRSKCLRKHQLDDYVEILTTWCFHRKSVHFPQSSDQLWGHEGRLCCDMCDGEFKQPRHGAQGHWRLKVVTFLHLDVFISGKVSPIKTIKRQVLFPSANWFGPTDGFLLRSGTCSLNIGTENRAATRHCFWGNVPGRWNITGVLFFEFLDDLWQNWKQWFSWKLLCKNWPNIPAVGLYHSSDRWKNVNRWKNVTHPFCRFQEDGWFIWSGR